MLENALIYYNENNQEHEANIYHFDIEIYPTWFEARSDLGYPLYFQEHQVPSTSYVLYILVFIRPVQFVAVFCGIHVLYWPSISYASHEAFIVDFPFIT